jgi:cyclopropane-fatty-acyl-phospholipid synthase
MSPLLRFATHFIRVGRLTITVAGGQPQTFGDGSGPEVAFHATRRASWAIGLHPELGLGEAYMDGALRFSRGTIYDLLDIVARNWETDGTQQSYVRRLTYAVLRAVRQWNGRVAARRNVAHHYDLSNDFYRRFLDPDMQYSCAYFARGDATLEEAQDAKKAHIAAKLALAHGQRVLDIGCGWGGLAMDLASRFQVDVLGVTLSEQQLTLAKERAQARKLDARVHFDLRDYRDLEGPFDRIVSVGMFEHVGRPNYQTFFDTIARLLDDNGVALVHAIGRAGEPGVTNPWIAKYIFPGGYVPALSEVLPAVQRAGLWVTDIEVLRLHYAETIRHWRARFEAQRDAISAMFDERFCRMFEFYLAGAEATFRHGGQMVFQLQLAKRIDALPITRDYMSAVEQRLHLVPEADADAALQPHAEPMRGKQRA